MANATVAASNETYPFKLPPLPYAPEALAQGVELDLRWLVTDWLTVNSGIGPKETIWLLRAARNVGFSLGTETRGSIISPVVHRLLRTTAERREIPFTVAAAGRDTSTDADAIHVAAQGVATGLVSVPNRYMHSPNEMVSLRDLDATAALLAEACRAVTAETDFTAR